MVKHANKTVEDVTTSVSFKLKEECLDISKKTVQTSDITIHKEIYVENRTITVPILHEQLVIQKNNTANNLIETIRISVREESIKISKTPKTLEEVKIYKHEFQEIKHIQEKLKKERLRIEKRNINDS